MACGTAYAAIKVTDDLYNAACCFALAGQADQAFAQLQRLATMGFHNVESLTKDEDLLSLHPDARWASLIEALGTKPTTEERKP